MGTKPQTNEIHIDKSISEQHVCFCGAFCVHNNFQVITKTLQQTDRRLEICIIEPHRPASVTMLQHPRPRAHTSRAHSYESVWARQRRGFTSPTENGRAEKTKEKKKSSPRPHILVPSNSIIICRSLRATSTRRRCLCCFSRCSEHATRMFVAHV